MITNTVFGAFNDCDRAHHGHLLRQVRIPSDWLAEIGTSVTAGRMDQQLPVLQLVDFTASSLAKSRPHPGINQPSVKTIGPSSGKYHQPSQSNPTEKTFPHVSPLRRLRTTNHCRSSLVSHQPAACDTPINQPAPAAKNFQS